MSETPKQHDHEFSAPYVELPEQTAEEFAREQEALNAVQGEMTRQLDLTGLSYRALERLDADSQARIEQAGQISRRVPYVAEIVVDPSDDSELAGGTELGVAFLLPDPGKPSIKVPVAQSYHGMPVPLAETNFDQSDANNLHTMAAELLQMKTSGEVPYLSADLTTVHDADRPAWPS